MIKLRPNVYVGNLQDTLDANILLEAGITTVLNVAFELSDPVYDPTRIRNIKVGLMDNGDNLPTIKHLAITTLVALITQNEKVLVHCAAGLSRAPYIASKALAEIEHVDAYNILKEIQVLNPMAMQGAIWHGEGYIPSLH